MSFPVIFQHVLGRNRFRVPTAFFDKEEKSYYAVNPKIIQTIGSEVEVTFTNDFRKRVKAVRSLNLPVNPSIINLPQLKIMLRDRFKMKMEETGYPFIVDIDGLNEEIISIPTTYKTMIRNKATYDLMFDTLRSMSFAVSNIITTSGTHFTIDWHDPSEMYTDNLVDLIFEIEPIIVAASKRAHDGLHHVDFYNMLGDPYRMKDINFRNKMKQELKHSCTQIIKTRKEGNILNVNLFSNNKKLLEFKWFSASFSSPAFFTQLELVLAIDSYCKAVLNVSEKGFCEHVQMREDNYSYLPKFIDRVLHSHIH